jgi:hypothetical protein
MPAPEPPPPTWLELPLAPAAFPARPPVDPLPAGPPSEQPDSIKTASPEVAKIRRTAREMRAMNFPFRSRQLAGFHGNERRTSLAGSHQRAQPAHLVARPAMLLSRSASAIRAKQRARVLQQAARAVCAEGGQSSRASNRRDSAALWRSGGLNLATHWPSRKGRLSPTNPRGLRQLVRVLRPVRCVRTASPA